MYLSIIHQLFDLDFRQFATHFNPKGTGKVFLMDRYYPSNLVYARLHNLETKLTWMTGHSITPDLTIFLRVDDAEEYCRMFPVYDTSVNIEDDIHGVKTTIQLLNPIQLFHTGQQFYAEVLDTLFCMGRLGKFEMVKARRSKDDATFKDVEHLLHKHEIL